MSIKDGPGEGGWSVFAEKVVGERDAALAKLAEAEAEVARLIKENTRFGGPDMTNWSVYRLQMYQDGEVNKMRRSLRNVLAFAKRMRAHGGEGADHLIRFCAEAGVEESPDDVMREECK